MSYILKGGTHRVTVTHATARTVVFHNEGGGFQHRLSKLEFDMLFEEAPTERPWLKSRFCFDDGPSYPGYHTGQRWNGWAVPCFSYSVARLICEPTCGHGMDLYCPVYDRDNDRFVLNDVNNPDDPLYAPGFPILFEGQTIKVYQIMDGWCWSEGTNDVGADWPDESFVPAYLSTPIEDEDDAISFIQALHAADKSYHFDDNPATIVRITTGEPLFEDWELPLIRVRVGECFDHLDDPFVWLMWVSMPRKFRITWLYGYGDADGESEIHNSIWFCEEMGFELDVLKLLVGLDVGESLETGGPMDRVFIIRLED